MEWYEIVVSILSGLAVTIPLVIQLVKFVQQAVREKNWKSLLDLVTNLMKEAEDKFANGADRREWVLTCVKATADTINYDINIYYILAFMSFIKLLYLVLAASWSNAFASSKPESKYDKLCS